MCKFRQLVSETQVAVAVLSPAEDRFEFAVGHRVPIGKGGGFRPSRCPNKVLAARVSGSVALADRHSSGDRREHKN